MPFASYSATKGYATFNSLMFPYRAPATLTTASALTYTAAQILGGFVIRNPNGAARSDLFPTAASIVASIQGCEAGTSFDVEVRNSATGAETITVTTNTGLTLSGTMTIAQNNQKRFIVVVTNATIGSEAVTVYSCGTLVF